MRYEKNQEKLFMNSFLGTFLGKGIEQNFYCGIGWTLNFALFNRISKKSKQLWFWFYQATHQCEVKAQCFTTHGNVSLPKWDQTCYSPAISSSLPGHGLWFGGTNNTITALKEVIPVQLQRSTARTLYLIIKNLSQVNGSFKCAFSALGEVKNQHTQLKLGWNSN